MRNRNVIFIGGIHGVGKTTLCKQILEEIKIGYYSASELIRRLDEDSLHSENKAVLDVEVNQDKLMTSVDLYMNKTKPCLLDGHFCLLDSEHNIIKIPKKVFENISPRGILIVCDSASNISDRIFCRDKRRCDVELLSFFQEREVEYSERIAKELNVRYKVFNVNDSSKKAIAFIKGLVEENSI